jgi:hypothetical protein
LQAGLSRAERSFYAADCFRIRRLLGFLPNVQGQKAARARFEFMDALLEHILN